MQVYPGFSLLEEKEVKDIGSQGYLFQHDNTKAQIMVLKNQDDNKGFTISFATPPYDDNGIAHIIEHSVLNGSKKFPTKEPFVELLKGSLNTFLNAMTFSDKTVYPVASRNQQDFHNLMEVYLDAVFYPLMLENPQILMQEGWHYHLEDPADDLIYKGVVYNEMRGAFSQPESELQRLFEPTLFPDTIYAHQSGGLPSAIPSLSFEKFVAFHKKYYHPSNAKVVLYGDFDWDKAFGLLAEYFDAFEEQEVTFQGYQQSPFQEPRSLEVTYPLAQGEEGDKRSLISLAWAAGKGVNRKEVLALSLLEEVLLGSNSAPLKKALLQAGLGSDIYGGYSAYAYETYFEVTVKDTDPQELGKIKEITQNVLEDLVANGISKTHLEACLNSMDFRYRELTAQEGSTPKGVLYAINTLTSWLYDGPAFDGLEFSQYIEEFRQVIDQAYFEGLIDRYFLKNPHQVSIVLAPQAGLGQERDQELAAKLAAYKESLSQDQVDDLVANTHALIQRQDQPDSPEALATIPKLSLKDINPQAPTYQVKEEVQDQVTYLFYEDFTAGIAYVDYFFDAAGLSQDEIPYAAFVTELLTRVATQSYSEEDLVTAIDFYTGGIDTDVRVFEEVDALDSYLPKFTLSAKAMGENIQPMLGLIGQILLHSDLTKQEKLKEILLNTKVGLEMSFNHQAHVTAIDRLHSYYSQAAKYRQFLSGLDYYDFICQSLIDLERDGDAFVQKLEQVVEKLTSRQGLVVAFTGSKDDYQVFLTENKGLLGQLHEKEVLGQVPKFDLVIANEGLKTAQEINYVVKGYQMKRLGFKPTGVIPLVQSILDFEYLWNSVRVKGGAYGGASVMNKRGDLAFFSYRDPNLEETLLAYNQAADFLAAYNPNPQEFEKMVIGTFSKIDRPLSAKQKSAIAVNRYFSKASIEDEQVFRQETLQARVEDIRAFAPILKAVMDQEALVVIGNDRQIQANEGLFRQVRNLF